MDKPAFTFQVYDFNLAAGGAQTILAGGAYLRILTATGAVDVVVEGKGTMPNLLAGQGLKDLPFQRVVLRDKSGAPNSGTILVASSEFVDNRLFGTFDLSPSTLAALESVDLNAATLASIKTPYASTGNYKANSAMVANTAEQVFSAAANTAGAIILAADFFGVNASSWVQSSLLAKAAAPASIIDGELVWSPQHLAYSSGGYAASGSMPQQAYLPAGVGLFFISSVATTVQYRSCRYKLL